MENGPAHDVNGPHVMAQGPIYNSCICQGARDKLPPPSPPIYMADPMGQGTPLLSSPLVPVRVSSTLSPLLGGAFSPTLNGHRAVVLKISN